jgi:hypothetical protein
MNTSIPPSPSSRRLSHVGEELQYLGFMPKLIDLSGQRYGRLVVIKRVGTRLGHPEWLCKCDCGKDHVATTHALRRGICQSCGCYRNEWLMLGPHQATTVPRPRVVEFTYPIPTNTEPVLARRYQWRWERVEREAKLIERGEPIEMAKQHKWEKKKFTAYDEEGKKITPIDLIALAKQKRQSVMRVQAGYKHSEVPSSAFCGASISDRIRVVSPEELARL